MAAQTGVDHGFLTNQVSVVTTKLLSPTGAHLSMSLRWKDRAWLHQGQFTKLRLLDKSEEYNKFNLTIFFLDQYSI